MGAITKGATVGACKAQEGTDASTQPKARKYLIKENLKPDMKFDGGKARPAEAGYLLPGLKTNVQYFANSRIAW